MEIVYLLDTMICVFFFVIVGVLVTWVVKKTVVERKYEVMTLVLALISIMVILFVMVTYSEKKYDEYIEARFEQCIMKEKEPQVKERKELADSLICEPDVQNTIVEDSVINKIISLNQ